MLCGCLSLGHIVCKHSQQSCQKVRLTDCRSAAQPLTVAAKPDPDASDRLMMSQPSRTALSMASMMMSSMA